MKYSKTTSVLVGLGLMLGLAYGYAQGNPANNGGEHTFMNNTGQAVSGLHLEYDLGFAPGLEVLQNPANTFAVVQYEGCCQFNLSSGTVASGGSVQIRVTSWGALPKRLQKWWWTDGSGILVGQIHNGCKNPNCTSP